MSSLRSIPNLLRNVQYPIKISIAGTSNPSYIVLKRPFKPKRKVLVPQVREADTNELLKSNSVVSFLNEKILRNDIGRLFAIVQFGKDQFKVTQNDIIVIEDAQYFRAGDKIKIEKILLVGSNDFTIFGRPLIPAESATVEATVVEKTFSETKMHFTMIGGKNVRILKAQRRPLSLLRINAISLTSGFPIAEEARDVWKDQKITA